MTAANDNAPEPILPPHPPVVGVVGRDGRVIITDPVWRTALLFPNDPREA